MIDDETPISELAEGTVADPIAAQGESLSAETIESQRDLPLGSPADTTAPSISVREIVVRVGAELGRATLPLAKAVGLVSGSVIELDRAADDPIDLYVNGRRFATGQLLLLDQNEWAIRIEHVLDVGAKPSDFVTSAVIAASAPDDLI